MPPSEVKKAAPVAARVASPAEKREVSALLAAKKLLTARLAEPEGALRVMPVEVDKSKPLSPPVPDALKEMVFALPSREEALVRERGPAVALRASRGALARRELEEVRERSVAAERSAVPLVLARESSPGEVALSPPSPLSCRPSTSECTPTA